MAHNLDPSILQSIDPSLVANFLKRRGYFQSRVTDVEYVFTKPDESSDTLLLPINSNDRAYSIILEHLLLHFRREHEPLEDIVARVILPECDVLRYHIAGPYTTWGTAFLTEVARMYSGLSSLVRFTAAGVLTQQARYTKVPRLATALADSCRSAQSEVGSYVLKMYCPIQLDASQDYFPQSIVNDTFGRTVTEAAVANLHFFTTDIPENPFDTAPAAFNKNVVDAICDLQPDSPMAVTTTTVTTSQVSPEFDQPRSVIFDSVAASRAKDVQRRLESRLNLEAFGGDAFVINLHRDRPGTPIDKVRQKVSFDLKDGSTWRKLRCSVDSGLYARCVQWHDTKVRLRIVGIADKSFTPWQIVKLNAIEPIVQDDNSGGLFT